MLDKRMIGRIVYDKYEFRRLSPSARDLYTYLLLNCDNDGVCDRLYDIMLLNKSNDMDIHNLIMSQFIYPLAKQDTPDMIVWLPDFLAINVIDRPKKYKPSLYREQLRDMYPWAPVLVVWDDKGNIRRDIINHNYNLPPDPRTGIVYKTPIKQIPSNLKTQITPLGLPVDAVMPQPPGLPPEKIKKNKINKNKNNILSLGLRQDYDMDAIEHDMLANN